MRIREWKVYVHSTHKLCLFMWIEEQNTLWSFYTWNVFDHVNWGTNALWSFDTWIVFDHVNWGTNPLWSSTDELCLIMWIGEQIHYGHRQMNCVWSCELGNKSIMVILHMNCAWMYELANRPKKNEGNYIHSIHWIMVNHHNWGENKLCLFFYIWIVLLSWKLSNKTMMFHDVAFRHMNLCLIMRIGEQKKFTFIHSTLHSMTW
jgi:hypothetical protein